MSSDLHVNVWFQKHPYPTQGRSLQNTKIFTRMSEPKLKFSGGGGPNLKTLLGEGMDIFWNIMEMYNDFTEGYPTVVKFACKIIKYCNSLNHNIYGFFCFLVTFLNLFLIVCLLLFLYLVMS